jgi:hypothetical protein
MVSMTKAKFIEVVESLFQIHPVDADVVEYFNKTVKSVRVNKKEVEKAETVRNAILNHMKVNAGKMLDRVEIGTALYNAGEFSEEFLLNEKGEVAYNSITAYANQLVNNGLLRKDEVRVGKVKKIKYSLI